MSLRYETGVNGERTISFVLPAAVHMHQFKHHHDRPKHRVLGDLEKDT